jgi:putative alpha-1,2-mannosidase
MGNYCHGNQPDHSVPYTYYFIDRQPKAQVVLDSLLNHYYDMGAEHLAYAGMDDAGEMSAWYVFNAIGLYTYSPADPEYIVTVPLFPKVVFTPGINDVPFIVRHEGSGRRIVSVSVGGKALKGWFVPHAALAKGAEVVIRTEE